MYGIYVFHVDYYLGHSQTKLAKTNAYESYIFDKM